MFERVQALKNATLVSEVDGRRGWEAKGVSDVHVCVCIKFVYSYQGVDPTGSKELR